MLQDGSSLVAAAPSSPTTESPPNTMPAHNTHASREGAQDNFGVEGVVWFPCQRLCDVRRRLTVRDETWRRHEMTTATTTTSTTNGVRVCARDDVHNMCIRRRRRPAGVAYVRRRPCRRRGAYMPPPPPVGGTKGFARWGRPPPRTVVPAHPVVRGV